MKADKFPACLGHVLSLHFAWGRYTSSNRWKNYSSNLRREMENFGEKKRKLEIRYVYNAIHIYVLAS